MLLTDLYGTPDTCCLISLSLGEGRGEASRGILDQFLADVHSGKLTADSIQPDYYQNLAKQLSGAVMEGMGGDKTFPPDNYRNTLKAFFDHNVYAFSAAKSLVMLQQYNKLLLDDKGETVSFAEFKKRVAGIDTLYNVNYLQAEYNGAIASAQMGAKWQELTTFPMLEYRTVGDSRVRPEHAVLDGLILKSTDPLWNRIYPPNAWNCRCTVIPAAGDAELTDRDTAKAREKNAGISPYFKGNSGKDKVIYKKDHPYFKSGRGDTVKELTAEKNYGMDSIDKIYAKSDLPDSGYLPDKTRALQWWTKNAGEVRGSFDVETADGLTVRFDNKFRNHVLEQNDDDRWQIIHQSPEILKVPDEIWSRMVDGKPSITYIKYYDKAPVVVQVDVDDKLVRASTMVEMQHKGKINTAEMTKIRRGQLKFKQ